MKTVVVERRQRLVDQQWAVIKQLRSEIESRPIETPAGTFQFDRNSRERLQAVVEARRTSRLPWYDVDDAPVDLSPVELRDLYADLLAAAGQRVLALGAFTRELRARLPLAEDDPLLRGEGWPG